MVSDNVTFVEVKSIGQIGVVAQKSIQLPPGDYLFVGERMSVLVSACMPKQT